MAWFGLAKIALQAGTHIFKKRQETKMAMADAQHMHAQKMAQGQEAYQGKLLEARQSDWKDEAVLINSLGLPVVGAGLGSRLVTIRPRWTRLNCSSRYFSSAAVMVYKFVDPCRGEHLWNKGDTNF
jgi:hypothetical protein